MNNKLSRTTGGCLTSLGLGLGLLAGCGSAGGGETLGAQAQAVYDYDENAGIFTPAPLDGSLRANIVVSIWKQGKWSVAGATNQGDGCTGTLISPRLVLTSSSCIRRLGNATAVDVYVGPRTPDVAAPGQAVKFQSQSIRSVATPSTQPTFSGTDLALITLNAAVLEQAIIHRPAFVAPGPIAAADADGWAPYAAGISGWSPYTMVAGAEVPEAQTTRQTFYKTTAGDDELRLNRYTGRRVWFATTVKPVSNLPKLGTAPGDNGGPLFTQGPNGRLDVIGVASVIGTPPDALAPPIYRWDLVPAHFESDCRTPDGAPVPPDAAPYQCDTWTDVTIGILASYIRTNSTDTTRTARWKASHPRVGEGQSGNPWIGEVDYGGPCDSAKDPDCDHTYTTNTDGTPRDNCANMTNVDQVDTQDVGMGDACVGVCAAEACTAANSCAPIVARYPRCDIATVQAASPSASYSSPACGSGYTATVDPTAVPIGKTMIPAVTWNDTPLTQATCATAKLDLTVIRQPQGGAPIASAHRYHGVWSSGMFAMCTFELDTGYSNPAPITRTANEGIKLVGSAAQQNAGVWSFKKVIVSISSGTGPC